MTDTPRSTYLADLQASDPALYDVERRGGGPQRHQPPEHEPQFLAALDVARQGVRSVSANCDTHYHAAHTSGRRTANDIHHICMHCTQGMTAVSAASWFQDGRSQGSAQLCIDAGACYRTMSDLEIPWAAPGLNTTGLHIELAGYAEWSRAVWLAHHGTLYRGAYKAWYHAHKYGIPLQWLTDAQLERRTVKGFTTHAQVTRVFGGTHTDPGHGFPADVFMRDMRAWANV
jgi:N-acetylmuramoyl-L-alanine amidase